MGTIMQYDFDKIIDRRGTDSVKHDLLHPVFGTENVLPMWVADMDFEVPDFICSAIRKRADHPVYGYTFRPRRFYEIIADWMGRRHQWDVDPDRISFSPGIVPALNLSVLAFTKPGDRIVIQPPVYFPFFSAIRDHDRELVTNNLVNSGGTYSMNLNHLEDLFREGARMMLFCHPHNPVGKVWQRHELEKLAELCIRYDVLVISDEIHSDLLLFGNSHIPFASLDEAIAARTITCIAPSKTFNLAGLHSSALIIPEPSLKVRYEQMLDRMHIGGGNLFGMVAMEAAYTFGEEWLTQLIHYLEKNALYLVDILGKELPDLIVSPIEATYLAWLDLSFLNMDDEGLKKFIIEKARLGLNDGPMFGPGGEGHQRINIAVPRKILEEAASRLVRAVKDSYI